MNNLNIYRSGYVFGLISILFFLVCMAWGTILFDPALNELHINLLRIAYPGFSMSLTGAIIGVFESFVYGWLFGAILAWACRKICISE